MSEPRPGRWDGYWHLSANFQDRVQDLGVDCLPGRIRLLRAFAGSAPTTTSLPPILPIQKYATPSIRLFLRGAVMIQLSGRGLLTTGVLLSFIAPGQSLDPYSNSTCLIQSEQDNVVHTISIHEVILYIVPYSWCTENCSGSNPGASPDFILILLAFALPAIIFSTIIPRRWRLDLPEQFFKVSRHRIFTISKLAISLPAICIVAALDMIGWITCIMTFAGPMVFGGLQEMLLDYRVVQCLNGNVAILGREKLEAVIALLCGNFDQDTDDPMTRIHSSLIPSRFTDASLGDTKSRLIMIMNAQTNFGMAIGIPAAFFF